MGIKLFIPGPVDVSEDVAQQMSMPMVGHRSKAYSQMHEETVERLKKLFKTENSTFLGTHSSTGWMEAAIRNCVNEKSLHIVNGAFSDRWYKIAIDNGKNPEKIDIKWGSAGKPEDVEKLLETGKYEALFITHNETSTAVMTPLEEFGEICRNNNVLLCIDAVSSAAGVEIDVDSLGIDVLVTGTQKAFAVPPGLSITVVSERALEKSSEVKNKGYYFDYQVHQKKSEKNNTPTTPAIPQINALNYQLGKIFEQEGLENRFKRHREMADYTRKWIESNWEMFAESWCASDTVSCAKNTRGVDLADLSSKLLEREYQFSNGYGKLKGEAFRVAHMGDRKMSELIQYLETVEEILDL